MILWGYFVPWVFSSRFLISNGDIYIFLPCFLIFLKVMVSKGVGTFSLRNLAMDMHLLGPVRSCWKMRAAGLLFLVGKGNTAGVVGKIEVLITKENAEVTSGKQIMGFQTRLEERMM